MIYTPPKDNPLFDPKKLKRFHKVLKLITNPFAGRVLNLVYGQKEKVNYKYLMREMNYGDRGSLAQVIMALKQGKLIERKGVGSGMYFVINELTREDLRLFLSEVK